MFPVMIHLSKSKFLNLRQCPKRYWLNENSPELAFYDSSEEARFEAGNEVGDLACGLFGPFVNVEAFKEDGQIDVPAMLKRTAEEIDKGTDVICEAAFSYKGMYCAVDILRRDPENPEVWLLYEVKSSTHNEKDVYIADVAYQKYVLEHLGLRVNCVFTVCINSDYVFDGTIDLKQFFKVVDVTDKALGAMETIPKSLSVAEEISGSDTEPEIDIGKQCFTPYDCPFWEHCSKSLPTPSVFDLTLMPLERRVNYYKKGVLSFEDLAATGDSFSERLTRQVDYALHDQGAYIDKEGIRSFLKTLSYPLYFLDFETMMLPVPKYPGTKPYQQIPFQYSLHYIEYEGGPLMHREFLGDSVHDPRRAIAESLCRDIPADVCVTAYNMSFESSRLRELAKDFPDLAEHLISIAANLRDFIDPFRQGFYYNAAMGGSFSIKSVLPALFPDDPSLDYHNLEGVHNGNEAKEIYPLIADMSPADQELTRKSLLKYCELDTYAMVRVWQELERVSH